MSETVYLINYIGLKKLATFIPIEINRTFDEHQEDVHFLRLISCDNLEYLKPFYIPQMHLSGGTYTDFAFSRIGLLTFNQRVVDAFDGELEEYGELYPLQLEDAPYPYYFYRINKMVNAMNLEAISKIDSRYQPGENYNSMSRTLHDFIPENIQDLLVFKDIQQNPPRITFLGQRFVDIVKKNKFTGIHKDTFKPIWPRPEP